MNNSTNASAGRPRSAVPSTCSCHQSSSYVISRKKTTERQKRQPILRLPRDDRKIVVRPRNLNLRSIPPGTLLATVIEDQLRTNTFTISTPSDERAQPYLNLPVMAYLPAPDNAVGGVIYGVLGDESAEEIIELCTIGNPKLQTLPARRMGQSRAMASNIYLLLSSDYNEEGEEDYGDHSEKKEKSRSHRSRGRQRSASRGRSSSRPRDRSASFPPLEGMNKDGSNQSGGRSGKSNSKTSNSHDNKNSEKTSRSRSSSSSKKAEKQVSWTVHLECELLE
ncbi:hypothetical protein HPB49_021701 [Dermacentor silvarum]|uniref:Uncharacterized protein n=1 Tax=Dermacentor silvarum TaxID=543639 RepID=A0ACB8DGC9_DERSI|nr:hypothetical protein HPB49_021701 [Dermacentor silvarum]